jgi:hypothetical protein
MKSPQNWGSRLHFSFMSLNNVSFAHHTASNSLTTKTLLGHFCDVSCLGLGTKLTWLLWSLSSELFYMHCQEILESELIHRSRKLSLSAESQGCLNQAAGHVSWGRVRGPLPRQNVKSQMSPQIFGIKDPLVWKTDTRETEKILTR